MIFSFLKKIKKSTRKFRKGFFIRNWVAGRIIEILGNKGFVSGMEFDLNNPYIETFLKCRFLFNTYEIDAEKLIEKYIKPELPVIELVGCIGVISCLTNKKLDNKTQHIVVEAQPYLIDTLKKNRDKNKCQFEIMHAALAYDSELVDFWVNKKYFVGNSTKIRTDAEGFIVKVPAISLKNIVEKNKFDKITLIVDIEGGETNLINNELKFMATIVDTLIIELHPAEWGAGAKAINQLKQDLKNAGFIKIDQKGTDYVYENQNI